MQLGHLLSMFEPGARGRPWEWASSRCRRPSAAIAHGGHVRVGLEDTNKLPNGDIATNYELVEHVGDGEGHGPEKSRLPAEAREILQMDPG